MEAVLQEHLDSGNYYEAHQVFKSQVARKKSRKKYKDAAAMAAKGCKLLAEHSQFDSATDLGQQMLELYGEADMKETPEILGAATPHLLGDTMLTPVPFPTATIVEISDAYPTSAVGAQTTLLKAAIKCVQLLPNAPQAPPQA